MLEEQAKVAVPAPTPVNMTKASPFDSGHEAPKVPVVNGVPDTTREGTVESDTSSDLENEYKEDIINQLADEDSNRKEVMSSFVKSKLDFVLYRQHLCFQKKVIKKLYIKCMISSWLFFCLLSFICMVYCRIFFIREEKEPGFLKAILLIKINSLICSIALL